MKKLVLFFALLVSSLACFAKNPDYKNEKYEALYKEKQFKAIVSSIEEADESSYTLSDYFYLGLAYFMMGNHTEAQKYFNMAVQEDPEFFDAYDFLGGSCYFSGDYEGAIANLKKCIELDEKNVTPYGKLGVIYEDLGDYETAYSYYLKLYKLEKSPDAAYALGYVLYEMQDYKKAKPYVEESLKHYKDSFTLNNLMVFILYSTGDYKKAAKYEKQLLEIWKNTDDEELKANHFYNIYSFEHNEYFVKVYERIDQDGDFYYPLTCNVILDGKVIKAINLEYDAYTAEMGCPYFLGIDEVETNTHYTTEVTFKKYPKFNDFINYVKKVLDGEVDIAAYSVNN